MNAVGALRCSGVVLLILAAALAGCSDKEPSLPVKEFRVWQMPPDGPRIPAPRSLAVGPRDEVVCLDTAGRVLVFDESGKLLRQWRMPESAIGRPEGVRVLKDGRIAVCDTHYSRVVLFDPEGKLLGTFGSSGAEPGQFIYPVAIAQSEVGDLYICEYGSNDRVQRFSSDGTKCLQSYGRFGTKPGEFQRPSGIVHHAGRLYVADAINCRITVFAESGEYLGVLGESEAASASLAGQGPPRKRGALLNFPYDIALGKDGAFYVVEYGAARVTKLSLSGELLGRYGTSGRGLGEFATPWGIAVDSKMRLRVADTGNRRIVELIL